MPSLKTVSGSGSFAEGTLISFSYSEDLNSNNPADLNGGTGQVTAQVVETSGQKGSRITINNELQLSDEIYGDVSFTAKKLSINNDLVSLTGNTIQSKLDVEVTAPPFGSNTSGYTLASAIVDYCALGGIVPNFEPGLEDKLDLLNVDFIGWQGNLWEHLKMLCAASIVDESDNTALEMYIKDDELWFREASSEVVDLSDDIVSKSISVDVYDAAQEVGIFRYITDYRSNSLIRQEGAENAGFANLENVSITDSMQVSALEKVVRRVKINASLESVNQPVPTFSITSVPYTGVTGEYVIVGKDSLPLTPAQWLGQGGSLTVALTENPNEIEITIVGANYPDLEPFRIGVESSGSENYPAFYITGTGVFFEKVQHNVLTGAPSDTDVQSPTIDNPFITSINKLWTRGVAAAQQICGPSYTISQQLSGGLEFGEGLGKLVNAYDVNFKLDKLSYSQTGITASGKKHVTISDFNTAWSGSTIEDFNTQMAGISFNEFSVIPLSKDA